MSFTEASLYLSIHTSLRKIFNDCAELFSLNDILLKVSEFMQIYSRTLQLVFIEKTASSLEFIGDPKYCELLRGANVKILDEHSELKLKKILINWGHVDIKFKYLAVGNDAEYYLICLNLSPGFQDSVNMNDLFDLIADQIKINLLSEKSCNAMSLNAASELLHDVLTPLANLSLRLRSIDLNRSEIALMREDCALMQGLVKLILSRTRLPEAMLTSYDLVALMGDNVRAMIPSAELLGKSLLYSSAVNNFYITTDLIAVSRILQNIILNSIRYGGANIFCSLNPGNPLGQIEIYDDGVGLNLNKSSNGYKLGNRIIENLAKQNKIEIHRASINYCGTKIYLKFKCVDSVKFKT